MTPPIPDHSWFAEHLPAYVAGALAPEETARFDAHLAECPDCTADLAALRATDSSLLELFAGVQPAADFEERLISSFQEATMNRRLIHPMLKRAGFGVAAAIALAATGVLASHLVNNNSLSNPISQRLLASADQSRLPGDLLGHYLSSGSQTQRAAAGDVPRLAFNFKDASVDSVLDYFSKVAGVIVIKEVPIEGKVTIQSENPVNEKEAVTLLSTVLKNNGYAAVVQGRTMKVTTRDRAKKMDLAVHVGSDPSQIPDSSEVITQVIPLTSIDAVRVRDKATEFLGKNADITANAGSNSLVITDTSANIRRAVAAIIGSDASRTPPSSPPSAASSSAFALDPAAAGNEIAHSLLAESSRNQLLDSNAWRLESGKNSREQSDAFAITLQDGAGEASDLALMRLKKEGEALRYSGSLTTDTKQLARGGSVGDGAISSSDPKAASSSRITFTGGGNIIVNATNGGAVGNVPLQGSGTQDSLVRSYFFQPNQANTQNLTNWTNFNGGVDVAASTDNFKINQGKDASGAGFIKSGVGTLVLSNQNQYTGGTTINAGALGVGSAGNTNALAANAASNAGVATFTRSLSGAGYFDKSGPGTLTLSGTQLYTNGANDGKGPVLGDVPGNGRSVYNGPVTAGTGNGAITGKYTAGSGTVSVFAGNSGSPARETLARGVAQATPPAAPGTPSTPASGGGGGSAAQAAAPAPIAAVAERKIVRSGQMEVEVASFEDAASTIDTVVTEEGGFISSTSSDKLANGKVRGVIVLRVPPDHLDRLVLKLRGLGTLKSQQIAAADVTKQYTDIESELRALRAMEDRLITIIKSGKGEVKDLVEAEKQLGEYRVRIEKLEGEIRYYNNLVALSTLNLTLYEKDIRTPATLTESENVNMSVETEDVESRYAAARKAIDDAKGRIVQSDLRKLDAGQFAATITAEVPSDQADILTAQLKSLGNVVRLERNRQQATEGGGGGAGGDSKPLPNTKVTVKDTRFSISMYNLANIAPRETSVLNIATADVEIAYRKILAEVRQASEASPATTQPSANPSVGRVVRSNLAGQRPEQMVADLNLDVRAPYADALLQTIRSTGEVLSSSITENPDSANSTVAKRGIQLHLVAQAAVTPRDTSTLQVAATDVPGSYAKILAALRTIPNEGGHVLVSQLDESDAHNINAHLTFDVPASAKAGIDSLLGAAGIDVVGGRQVRNPDPANTLESRIRYDLSLADARSLPARRTSILGIELPDVEKTLADLRTANASFGGTEVAYTLSRDNAGRIVGKIVLEVPIAHSMDLLTKIHALNGDEKVDQTTQNPSVPDTKLARERYELTLSNPHALLAENQGFSTTLRSALAAAAAYLFISLYWIITGFLFLAPWLLLAGLIRMMYRRFRRKSAAA